MSAYLGLREPLAFERGYLDAFQPAAPAAGSNLSYNTGRFNAPTTRLLHAAVVITTDANAANRVVSLDYTNARGIAVASFAPTVIVTAGLTATTFRWSAAYSVSDWNTGATVFAPLDSILLEPGWTIGITIASIQAGDTITSPRFLHEHFFADSASDPQVE